MGYNRLIWHSVGILWGYHLDIFDDTHQTKACVCQYMCLRPCVSDQFNFPYEQTRGAYASANLQPICQIVPVYMSAACVSLWIWLRQSLVAYTFGFVAYMAAEYVSIYVSTNMFAHVSACEYAHPNLNVA